MLEFYNKIGREKSDFEARQQKKERRKLMQRGKADGERS